MEVKWRVEWPSTRQGVRSKIDQGALLARCQKQGLTLEMLAQKHPLGCEFHILRGAQATAFETLEPKFTVTVAETFFAKPTIFPLSIDFSREKGQRICTFYFTKTQGAEGFFFSLSHSLTFPSVLMSCCTQGQGLGPQVTFYVDTQLLQGQFLPYQKSFETFKKPLFRGPHLAEVISRSCGPMC